MPHDTRGGCRFGCESRPAELREPKIAICMAAYRPKPELFRRQIDSIMNQTHRNWVLVISDETDADHTGAWDLMNERARARCIYRRQTERAGFAVNFERAALLAPPCADYIAFSDQDDDWYPKKLERSLEWIGDNGAVFTDFNAVDVKGRRLSDTQWVNRDVEFSDITSMVFFNAVSGASMIANRETVARALPLPRFKGILHDHWIALIALATTGLAHVPEALYDYVQHGDNAIGFNSIHNRRRFLRQSSNRVRTLRSHNNKATGAKILAEIESVSDYSLYCTNLIISLLVRLDTLDAACVDQVQLTRLKEASVAVVNGKKIASDSMEYRDFSMPCKIAAANKDIIMGFYNGLYLLRQRFIGQK